MTEPSPGDQFRIVVVGDPVIMPHVPQKISAFVTGLDNPERSDCRNNDTGDRRYLVKSATDTMDCRGIDVGYGYLDILSISETIPRVAIGFNGAVSNPDVVICPCFSRDRLASFAEFSKINNSPECIDSTDANFNSGGIQAIFPSSFILMLSKGQIDTGTCQAIGSSSFNGDHKILFDKRDDLTQEQLIECREIVKEFCP